MNSIFFHLSTLQTFVTISLSSNRLPCSRHYVTLQIFGSISPTLLHTPCLPARELHLVVHHLIVRKIRITNHPICFWLDSGSFSGTKQTTQPMKWWNYECAKLHLHSRYAIIACKRTILRVSIAREFDGVNQVTLYHTCSPANDHHLVMRWFVTVFIGLLCFESWANWFSACHVTALHSCWWVT